MPIEAELQISKPRHGVPVCVLTALAALSWSGCGAGMIGPPTIGLVSLVTMVAAMRYPSLCLGWGIITGAWTAVYGPYLVLEHANHSTSTSILFDSVLFEPFNIINANTTWFLACYAWLLVGTVAPWSGWGIPLLVISLAATLVGLEISMTSFWHFESMPGLIALVAYVAIGLIQIRTMVKAIQERSTHQSRARNSPSTMYAED